MSINQTKSLKERVEELIESKPYNFIRTGLTLENAIGDLSLEIKDEIKNLNDIEIKIMMQEAKIMFERIRNSLNELEIKINPSLILD